MQLSNALHAEGMNFSLIFNMCKISGLQSLKLSWKKKTKQNTNKQQQQNTPKAKLKSHGK